MTDKEIIELFRARDMFMRERDDAQLREMAMRDGLNRVARIIGDILIQEETNPQSSKAIIQSLIRVHQDIMKEL